MPLRSSGCFACRKRKIRCDEARPDCQRCATHGITCPGYRGDRHGGIEFKDQTDVTVSRAKGMSKRGSKLTPDTSTRDGRVEAARLGGRASSKSSFGCATGNFDYLSPASSTATQDSKSHGGGDFTMALSPQSRASPAIPTLKSPAIERAALYQSFIVNYLPRRTLQGIQEGHFSFFQTLALQRSEAPALQHGFDALSLAQLGSVHHDENLLNQATEQYGLALRALSRCIAKGDFLRDDDVLAAVTVLSTCELFESIQVQGQGWSNHIQGANKLVAARGPESLQSDLALLLFVNMRHGAMCHALIDRKAPFLAQKKWRDVAWRVPAQDNASNAFYEYGIQVPGLLERHDRLDLSDGGALDEVNAILAECLDIESELRKWFAAWSALADATLGGLRTLVPITDFPTFLGLCSDTTFSHAYRFPDVLVGYLQSLCWMTMHFLRANIQSLHKKRHQLDNDWYPDADEEVSDDELLEYVLDLCRSIPYFCEPETCSTGSIAIFLPMRTAAIYFTAHGHWPLLRWIGSVRNNVFVRGLKPPAVDGRPVGGQDSPRITSAASAPG